ncbi:MAG: InlB B-repeat-containing protein [Atopobiaceae bacterium]|nr:InlB B-repeat-containing protein [Atopobiaceae bacterium]
MDGCERALQPAEKRTISYGVDVLGNGVLTLNNGTITGFESGVWTDLQAGDEENKASFGKFVMNGGTIKGNSQRGVYVFSGTFEMNGGTICQNGDSGDDGAGVYVNYSTFKMSGGEISNNTAKRDGGGVFISNKSKMDLSGTASVVGNEANGVAGNVYLDNALITVTGKLADGAAIGVTRVSADVAAEAATGAKTDKDAFTTGYKSTGNSVDPETYFFSDDDKKLVGWTTDGEEARFVDAYTVTVNDTQNGTVESSKSKARAGDTVSLTITPDEGYALSSLLVTDANKEAVEVVDNAFTMPQSDVTVDATFAATHCTISFDANGGTGIMDDQVVAKGETTALNENEFSRSGYAFTGWNTAKNGSGASFKDKEEVSVTSNMKLYAQWKASPSGSSNAGSATGSTTESRTSLASTADSSSCAGTVACVLLGVTAVTAGLRKTAFRKR